MRFATSALIAATAAVMMMPTASLAEPGDTLTAERARITALGNLTPITATPGATNRFETHPSSGPSIAQGDDGGWSLSLATSGAIVTSESIAVKSHDPLYRILTSGQLLIAHVFGTNVVLDLSASTTVATQHDDPSITQTFRRGAHFAYRTVDDERNSMHLVEVMTLPSLAQELKDFGAAPATTSAGAATTPAPIGQGDAIFAVNETGNLTPVAVRKNGSFFAAPNSSETQSDQLRLEALAAISSHDDRVHVIFGNRVIATEPVTIVNGAAAIPPPPTLHLNGNVEALASPTLGASSGHARRAPTHAERAAALALAAGRLNAPPARLTVLNLTAIDLNRGTAFVGTINLPGTSKPRHDKRMFFVAETVNGKLTLTLANIQAITVTEPLLEEVNEYLIDALSLGNAATAIVTRDDGYDASTFNIYTRSKTNLWQKTYSGGGTSG
jgi:hypothetical protein